MHCDSQWLREIIFTSKICSCNDEHFWHFAAARTNINLYSWVAKRCYSEISSYKIRRGTILGVFFVKLPGADAQVTVEQLHGEVCLQQASANSIWHWLWVIAFDNLSRVYSKRVTISRRIAMTPLLIWRTPMRVVLKTRVWKRENIWKRTQETNHILNNYRITLRCYETDSLSFVHLCEV